MRAKLPPCVWQISYPAAMPETAIVADTDRFVQRFTQLCRDQGDVIIQFPWIQIPYSFWAITLNYHTQGVAPNSYHYKDTYLNEWLQVDTHGYSGFHSKSVHMDRQPGFLMPVPPQRLPRIRGKIANYLATRKSKYKQKHAAEKFDFPYIFFPLQKPQDEAALFGRFLPEDILAAALPWCRQNGFKLVLKRHPNCYSKTLPRWLETLKDEPDVIITQGDVVDLLEQSRAVITVNSSVGFEALLRNIPAFLFGKSEYSYLAHEIYRLEELPAALDSIRQNFSAPQEAIEAFIAAHLYDTNDPQDIEDLYHTLKERAFANGMGVGKIIQPMPQEIDFTEGGNSTDYTLHGFDYTHSDVTWFNQKKATLVFNYEGIETKFMQMSAELNAFFHPEHPTFFVDVLVNGKKTANWLSINAVNKAAGLKLPLVIFPGVNTISFVVHNPVFLAEIPMGLYSGMRSIGLQRLRFEEV